MSIVRGLRPLKVRGVGTDTLDLARRVALQSGYSRIRCIVGCGDGLIFLAEAAGSAPKPVSARITTTVSGSAKALEKGALCTETEVSRGRLSDG
jgi:hypothetical protein